MSTIDELVQEFAEVIEADFADWSPGQLRAALHEFADNILSGDDGAMS